MLQRILVPLDGSLRAEQAIPVAARIAHISGGTLVLLQVTGIPLEYEPALYASYVAQTPFYAQELLNAELAKAQYYLVDLAQSERLKGITTVTEVRSGAAAPAILEFARAQQVDLIVMCSHGRTGFTRWALGSVAQKIARHSPVPVLVLREGNFEHTDRVAEAAQPVRALVALDGSPLAEAALVPAAQLVASLAAPAQGALHLAQIVTLPMLRSEQDYKQHDGEARKQALQEAIGYLSTVVDNLRNRWAVALDLKVTWSVAVNEDVADAIIRMAELGEETGAYEVQGCDLIAMATHGRGGLQRWMLGSITERVLDGTKLPLLIVRPQGLITPPTSV